MCARSPLPASQDFCIQRDESRERTALAPLISSPRPSHFHDGATEPGLGRKTSPPCRNVRIYSSPYTGGEAESPGKFRESASLSV